MFMEMIIVSWKCSLNGNAFLNKNSNMFTIKWLQYRWRKQLVRQSIGFVEYEDIGMKMGITFWDYWQNWSPKFCVWFQL
jgi:hypothetical protein